ncbi:motility associated factor glycosyltransferase family protein [Campylobacter jejuni]|nr:motility associated factor glycosyltransferase family protein [Campylobacter jejuni]
MIFCADGALSMLEKKGIVPDYVTNLDFTDLAMKFFQNKENKTSLNILSCATHPSLVCLLDNKSVILRDDPLYQRFNLNDFGYIDTGTHVSHFSYTLALALGFKNIIIIGQDLAFDEEGNIGGKIESTGSADMVISNSNGGTISGGISSSGSGSTSISNSQGSTINNGITVSGSAQVEISNQGSVGKDSNGNTVTNNGSGSVGIKDWLVSTDKNTGKLNTVVIGGSGKDNVKVENITVDQSNVDLEELNDINNIISGVNQNNIGNIGTNGSGEISLSYDPITGKLTTDFNLNASISGATFRSLISTTSRRSTFIDNVMGKTRSEYT